MLLCLTTFSFLSNQSCKREAPQLFEDVQNSTQQPIEQRDLDDIEEECNCCIRFIENNIDADEGNYTFQLSAGYNGLTDPCQPTGTNIECPFVELQHGDCSKDIYDSDICTTSVDANNDERCIDFNCIFTPGETLFFSTVLTHVMPSPSNDPNAPCTEMTTPLNGSISFEIICESNRADCYGVDDEGPSDNNNPSVPNYTNSTIVTIVFNPIPGSSTSFGSAEVDTFLSGNECCRYF